MIGKYAPPQMITPEEAFALFDHAGVSEMNTAKALLDFYLERRQVNPNSIWDVMSVLSFIYDTGRIQGIREERARAKIKAQQAARKRKGRAA